MLQRISYFNLMYAIAYALIYFREFTLNFTMGILMIVIFNWLALRSYQIENYKWSVWHYIIGACSLYYIGFLLYGTYHVIHTSIEYQFVSNDTIMFIVLCFTLSCCVLIQFLKYFLMNLGEIRK